MNFGLGLTVGLIVGILGAYFMMKSKAPKDENKETPLEPQEHLTGQVPFINPKVETRKENLAKLEKLIGGKSKEEKITNDEVQKLLKVSDATAERYLQELEGQGKLKQFGEVGKEVYYQKV